MHPYTPNTDSSKLYPGGPAEKHGGAVVTMDKRNDPPQETPIPRKDYAQED